jgi:acyl carrier protein
MKSKNNDEKIIIELLNIINKILKKYKKNIKKNQVNIPFYSSGILDSLDFVNLIQLIEKKYNFKFNLSEIDVDITIHDLSKLVLRKKK